MDIEKELKKYFGFEHFRQGQKEVISKVISGESSAAIFPTGAGKSLCYQLPALLLPHITLVVSPLLSLMKDQLDFLLSHNIKAARLDSSLSREEYNGIISDALNNKINILMISVERFKNERFRTQLQKMQISLLVIDEAHCISEWGHNFRPEYLRLPEYQREFKIEKTLLLTATATKEVTADMRSKFNIKEENVVSTGFYRKNLHLIVTPIKENEKKNKLLIDLQESPEEAAIVYVTLQNTSEEIAGFLNSHKIGTAAYHGGMKNDERIEIQNQFMNGSLNCVVATIAFGMGIDKNNIRKIIHYNLPKSIENYSQEIGRSGRDGKRSICEVYGDKSNLPILENFVFGDTPEKESIITLLEDIKSSGSNWETKLLGLSRDTNIRTLPLKTLLVYLSIENIIKPKYSYFEKYVFKYLKEPEWISGQFEGERKTFVDAIIKNCNSKKVWTTVDLDSVCREYDTDRQRVLTALDYFDEKNWIDLSARQTVEVYEVLNKDFDLNDLAKKMYDLFKKKEKNEIARIHKMIDFFEHSACFSRELAFYFGEVLEMQNCGHCSACENGSSPFDKGETGNNRPPLEIETMVSEVSRLLGPESRTENITKFLCGLTNPLFNKLRIKKSAYFGILEKFSYIDVRKWVEEGNLHGE
ncbi:MAG: RecQ family ATP-dependent DNA helicase [Spirochaetaceae bacterium]|jgi:ATP-dependent DNA helicase RecQ|nr:RecQ family ATP-dependent DNA helicase [Spirochaetaceae bacterium]